MSFTLEKPKDEEKEFGLDAFKKLGVEVPEELEGELEETITQLGEEFFRKIESGNELYWTFSPFGEAIVESGKVVPGAKAPTQVTHSHSQGVHFTKPGIFAKHALGDINYVNYAKTESTLGGRVEPINSTFGIAVAFPISYLASVSPYRQAPRESRMDRKDRGHQTEQDIVFFRSDDKQSRLDYEYDLKEAYVYLVSRGGMREDDRVKDVFEIENIRRLHSEGLDSKFEAAKIIFKQYGFSEDWISKHVIALPFDEVKSVLTEKQWEFRGMPDVEDRDKQNIAELILATRKVHDIVGQDETVVVPIEVRDGAFESTDDSFLVQQSQIERLVVLPIKKDQAA